MSTMKLYNYFRSSPSYRVRIALHYLEIPFEYVPVHLLQDGKLLSEGNPHQLMATFNTSSIDDIFLRVAP